MSPVFIVLGVLLFLIAIALNVVILMQGKRSAGLSGAMGGMGDGQTYWDKNKGRSKEGQLEKYTKILGLLFFVIVLALNVFK